MLIPKHAEATPRLYALSLWPLRFALLEWACLRGCERMRPDDPWRDFVDNLPGMIETWMQHTQGPFFTRVWMPGAFRIVIRRDSWSVQASAVVDPSHVTFSSSRRQAMMLAGDAVLWTPALAWAIHLSFLRIGRASFALRGKLGAVIANVGRVIDENRFRIARDIIADRLCR